MNFLAYCLFILLNLIVPSSKEIDPCDPEQYSFKDDVFPIIEKKCLFCHNDLKAEGEINLKDYEHILPFAQNGQLLGSIKHEEGYLPMPSFGSPLNECEVMKIENWVQSGAKEE